MSYAIVVDSTTDLPAAYADELGVHVIPYIFTLDGKDYHNYLDYREISAKNFYDALRGGKLGTTTQVTVHRYLEHWEPYLQEGKDIFYMCLSSMLSKSYDQCVLAAREACEKYPDRKIVTIDTKSASVGQGLLALKAAQARDEGKTIEELSDYIEELIPQVHHWVMADDLNHLKRGGRVSSTRAFIGTMLNVKPILTITDEGKLVPISKARGHSKAFETFAEKMDELSWQPDSTVFIAHGDAIESAVQLKTLITEKFGIKDIVVTEFGPVIGAHAGPGTVALVFQGSGARSKV